MDGRKRFAAVGGSLSREAVVAKDFVDRVVRRLESVDDVLQGKEDAEYRRVWHKLGERLSGRQPISSPRCARLAGYTGTGTGGFA